jgi:hypothetical protein
MSLLRDEIAKTRPAQCECLDMVTGSGGLSVPQNLGTGQSEEAKRARGRPRSPKCYALALHVDD